MKRIIHILTTLAFFFGASCIASAQDEPKGTIDISAAVYGFTPGALYGPWDIPTIEGRTQAGLKDKPGFALTERTDQDGAATTRSTSFSIDDYHDWSAKFSTYASIGISSGTILPRSQYYIEADPKIGEHLIFGAGFGTYNEPNGLRQQYISIGPTFYFSGGNATLRYVPLWTTGQTSAPSFTANLSLGQEGKTVTSFSYQGGVQPLCVVSDPTISGRLGNKTTVLQMEVRHWLSPRLGYHMAGEVASQVDRLTGTMAYDQRGIIVGIFF